MNHFIRFRDGSTGRVSRLRTVAILLVGLWLTGCSSAPRSHEPLNLSEAKRAVLAYVDSGDYERAMIDVASQARAWIRERTDRKDSKERLVVVFDIDETVLSNLPHMREMDFGYLGDRWNEWVARGEAPVLAAMRGVYEEAVGRGVAVVFVTGRLDPRDREGTERNLRTQGMGGYTQLVLALPEEKGLPTSERKRRAREQLEAQGFVVIAAVGDQWSDLEGGHAERLFKVPNPFYLIP
ncbi:MAG: HAD family acid phosphatase [Opitutaceae bacterium]